MSDSGKRITFVVPFYNVEKYIIECLDSIYANPLPEDEYEVMCVDDCSPDSSRKLVEEYGSRHENLRVVAHDSNKRLGGGRNTGITNARGRYIWFVDSDDQIVSEEVSHLLDLAESNNLDVLSFNFCKFGKDGETCPDYYWDSEVVAGKKYVECILGEKVIAYNGFAWSHIYDTAYLREKELRFPENVYWEDTVFVIESIYRASRTMSVKDIAYRYRTNWESISFNPSAQARIDWCFKAGYDWYRFGVSISESDVSSIIIRDANKRYLRSWLYWTVKSEKSCRDDFVRKVAGRKDYPLWSYDNNRLSFGLLNRSCLHALIKVAETLYKIKKKCRPHRQ